MWENKDGELTPLRTLPGLLQAGKSEEETKAIVTMVKDHPYLLNECICAFNKS